MFITYTTPIWWLVGVKNFLQLGNIFFIKRLKLYWFGWKIKHKIYIYYELSETETRSAGSLQSWRGWRGTETSNVGNVLWNETNRIGLFSECNIFLKEYLNSHIGT